MLFNDSGFVRFRMGNEGQAVVGPASAVEAVGSVVAASNTVEMQLQQPQNLTGPQTVEEMQNKKKSLRASQSFDEGVLGGQDEPQVFFF